MAYIYIAFLFIENMKTLISIINRIDAYESVKYKSHIIISIKKSLRSFHLNDSLILY